MNLLPYQRFRIQTNMPLTVIVNKLRANTSSIRPFPFLWTRQSDLPLEGRVTFNSFTLNKPIRYRNSFNAIAHGKISQRVNEVVIDITITIDIVSAVFISLFLLAIITSSPSIFVKGYNQSIVIVSVSVILGMVVIGYNAENVNLYKSIKACIFDGEEDYQYSET